LRYKHIVVLYHNQNVVATDVSACDVSKQRVYWEEPKKNAVKGCVIQYDGTPFLIRSLVILNCQHGKDRNVARRKKEESKRKSSDKVNLYIFCHYRYMSIQVFL